MSKFPAIKEEVTAMIDDILRQFLNNKAYDKDRAQSWCNNISAEIKNVLQQT
jgi:hypothetical protein